MSAKLQYFLLLIGCFGAPSSNSACCSAGHSAVTVTSRAASSFEESHCSFWISAYGVSAQQYRRIENNWNRFQSVCPAPSPASVDFVVIFTHDVNFYDYTMPAPVHTDSSGFSDWSAIVLLDNTAPAAKYKREYVWVFRFKGNSFEPRLFSPHAKPDYSGVESGAHASDRAVDAAFKFIARQEK